MYVLSPKLERDVAVLKPNPFQFGVISCGSVSGERVRSLPDLGEALVNVLQMLTLSERLTVACTSRDLRDFVYDHFELWPNLSAVGSAGGCPSPVCDRVMSNSPFEDTLDWAQARGRVRRLRAVINPHCNGRGCSRPADPSDRWIENSFLCLSRCIPRLDILISLHISLDVGSSMCPASDAPFVTDLINSLPSTLKQLTLRIPNLHLPASTARLTALSSLALHSPDTTGIDSGVILHPNSLPKGLLHLEIGSLGPAALPEALAGVAALQSLAVDWAGAPAEAPIIPDFSLLENSLGALPSPDFSSSQKESGKWNTSHLTHLSLGYFQAAALPRALPPTLKSLELQWNLTTCEPACIKAGFNIDEFHASFSSLAPLTALTHLNLNKALGGWGLPPAVLRLTQLESLGVTGTDPGTPWTSRGTDLASQLGTFKKLKKLDVEIYDAAAGWEHLTRLTNLERLRLGRGEQPEAYVAPNVQATIGRGLVKLLPGLPKLKEVHTEGMLLPATAACARWARLAGANTPEAAAEAAAAIESLHARQVVLQRWYAWPFWPCGEGMVAWDEVK